MGAPLVQHGLSFSSVDYIAPSSEYHPLESIPEGVTVHFRDPIQNSVPRKNHIKFCKALYDFDGKTGSELSFKAGDIIKVVRTKTPRGGDDGWWEGELCGRAGLFPSLVVEPVTDKPRPGYGSPQSQRRSEPQKLEIVEFDQISEQGLTKVFWFELKVDLKLGKPHTFPFQCDKNTTHQPIGYQNTDLCISSKYIFLKASLNTFFQLG